MVRWSMLMAGAAVVAGAAFVAGGAVPPRVDADAGAKVALPVAAKTGYVNIARVMQQCERAKQAVVKLNGQRTRAVENIVKVRAMHQELQGAVQKASDPGEKDRIGRELITLARWIEDTDREMNKKLNDQAQATIAEIFKDIRAAAAEMAKANGLVAVNIHPGDPNTTNPQEMELLLRPPALAPIYLDPACDYTAELVRRLNQKFEEGDAP